MEYFASNDNKHILLYEVWISLTNIMLGKEIDGMIPLMQYSKAANSKPDLLNQCTMT
jgi:hypothetical protein